MNASKEWAKLFLENWDRAVELWDNGRMFSPSPFVIDGYFIEANPYTPKQMSQQREYARICCAWLIPNGMAEPHCVAEGG